MGRDREQVAANFLDINRDFSGGLDSVGVKPQLLPGGATIFDDAADLGDGLDGADLVVGGSSLLGFVLAY